MQLNTRVPKKNVCLYGKFGGPGYIFVVVSVVKISKFLCELGGDYKVSLLLLVDVPGCSCSLVYMWNINEDAYMVTDRVKVNYSTYC